MEPVLAAAVPGDHIITLSSEVESTAISAHISNDTPGTLPKTADVNDEGTSAISTRLRRRTRAATNERVSPVPCKRNKKTTAITRASSPEDKEESSQEGAEDIRSSDSDNPSRSDNSANASRRKTDQPSKCKVKGFECGICGRITSSSQRLKEHLSRHTGEKHLQCEICGKKFAWRYSFRSHMASHSNDNPNECTVCGKKYCNKSAVKNHMLRIHGNPSKDFKCEKCGKGFMTKAELERHGFNHSKEKPFVCEFCGNSYRFKGALAVHYRVHSGERPYKCGFCDMTFIHMSSVIGHRRRHTGEMPFQCNVCGKLFRVKRAMTAHMSVHSDERPFKCEECGKTFRSRSGYRVHLDFHLGVKRHTCKYCGRAFRAWCNMHKHMRRHIGERPHVCEVCGKAFIEKQELRNHMKCHSEGGQKPRKKKEAPPCTSGGVTVPEIPPPVITHPPPNVCSTSSFDNSQQSNAPLIAPHIELPENSHPTVYDPLVAMEKNRPEKCQLLTDGYVPPPFFPPQHSAPQYIPQSASMQNLYAGTQPNHLGANRTPCISNVTPPNFNCAPVNNQNYGGFSFNMQHSSEPLSKCKLCRSLFQSTLGLKRHLLEYHRIDEENVEELMA